VSYCDETIVPSWPAPLADLRYRLLPGPGAHPVRALWGKAMTMEIREPGEEDLGNTNTGVE